MPSSVTVRRIVMTFCCASAAIAALPAHAQEPAPPLGRQAEETPVLTNVAGRWELNWRASDRPSGVGLQGEEGRGGQPPQDRGAPPRAGVGGGGGRGGMMGGRGGARGERPARPGDEALREQLRDMLTPSRVLVIVERPDRIVITDKEGRVEEMQPTGAKTTTQHAGGTFEHVARWEGRALISEITLSDGTRVTRRYEKVAEGLQLVVRMAVENGRLVPPMQMKRVYDQALQEQ